VKWLQNFLAKCVEKTRAKPRLLVSLLINTSPQLFFQGVWVNPSLHTGVASARIEEKSARPTGSNKPGGMDTRSVVNIFLDMPGPGC
jgi:hypothetical protein